MDLFAEELEKKEKTEYVHPSEVYRSKDTVFVKAEGETLSSDKYTFYALKDDEIWVKKTHFVNSYGKEMTPKLKITTKEQ